MLTFDKEVNSFLKGGSFSNALNIRMYGKREPSYLRMDLLQKMAADKKVLHVGFADHIPVIETKIRNDLWLHKKLIDVSSKCFGIDIDEDAVDYVSSRLNISNVYKLDIVNDAVPEVLKCQWDVMILGEVLEHIDNPVAYLQSIREKYRDYVLRMVITVPNAFSFQNVMSSVRGVELINSDHRYWFTPYTLAKVCTKAGFTIDSFTMCQYYSGNRWWRKKLVDRYPLYRDNIMMNMSFNG